jgi:hypothetical protein
MLFAPGQTSSGLTRCRSRHQKPIGTESFDDWPANLASSFQSNRLERWAGAASMRTAVFLLKPCLERVGVGTELTKILG